MDKATYTINQFCEAHNISRAFYYIQLKSGKVPKAFRLGNKLLISIEAAKACRKKMQKQACIEAV